MQTYIKNFLFRIYQHYNFMFFGLFPQCAVRGSASRTVVHGGRMCVYVYFSYAVAYLCVTPLINFVRIVSTRPTVALVANIRLFLCLSYIVVNQ